MKPLNCERTPLLAQGRSAFGPHAELNTRTVRSQGDDNVVAMPESQDEEQLLPHQGPEPWYTGIFCCFPSRSAREASFGIVLVVLAGLSFTLANVIQKIVAPELSFWHLLFYRATFQIVVMGLALIRLRLSPLPTAEWGLRIRLVVQGLLGGLLLLCIFISIKSVPLGNASSIFFCTPVFTFIFAVCMLNERMASYRTMISIFMITGVVLITRPPFVFPTPDTLDIQCPERGNVTNHTLTSSEKSNGADHGIDLGANELPSLAGNCSGGQAHSELKAYNDSTTIGYMCCVCVPLLSAVVSIMTRQLKTFHPSVLMFWFACGAFLVGTTGVTWMNQWSHLFHLGTLDWIYVLAILVLGIFGNVAYTIAVRFVSPSKANVFRSFEVILNFILQVELEHTPLFPSNFVGIFLLLLAVVSTGFESEVMKRLGHKRWTVSGAGDQIDDDDKGEELGRNGRPAQTGSHTRLIQVGEERDQEGKNEAQPEVEGKHDQRTSHWNCEQRPLGDNLRSHSQGLTVPRLCVEAGIERRVDERQGRGHLQDGRKDPGEEDAGGKPPRPQTSLIHAKLVEEVEGEDGVFGVQEGQLGAEKPPDFVSSENVICRQAAP
eukprot:maker-scaffold628_size122696-snap-gene-0.30 protein:Tk01150 transcript:maker-scaffold628_size122696-snap-gene-0.30-mRNA-1 annotation:"transmembrane protein 20"